MICFVGYNDRHLTQGAQRPQRNWKFFPLRPLREVDFNSFGSRPKVERMAAVKTKKPLSVLAERGGVSK
jgi:hypothetical protein